MSIPAFQPLFVRLLRLLLLTVLLASCKPSYPNRDPSLPLYPTLSSDGKLLAVLQNVGQETPRLRLKWLDRDEAWLDLPAPKYTSSIRFGLTGYRLLLTHAQPGPRGASQLSVWDASQPTLPSEVLFEGTRLVFPVEVKPGQILIRMCPQAPGDDACARGHGLVWALVENGRATPITATLGLYPMGTPNVLEDGFFWTLFDGRPEINLEKTKIFSFGFPGKEPPKINSSMLDEKSRRMRCDSQMHRCLINYITEKKINGAYVYGFKALFRGEVCFIPGVEGYQDDFSLTEDGSAAVISSARHHLENRRIVVLSFTEEKCDPDTVLNLE